MEMEELAGNERSENVASKKEEIVGVKQVALTFDDGPHPKNTHAIMALLEKYNAKGTFFQVGRLIDEYPEITKKFLLEDMKSLHILGTILI